MLTLPRISFDELSSERERPEKYRRKCRASTDRGPMGNAEKPYRRAITTWPSRGPHNYALPRPRPLLIHDLSMPLRRRSFDPSLRPPLGRRSLSPPLGTAREAFAAFARTQVSIQNGVRIKQVSKPKFLERAKSVVRKIRCARSFAIQLLISGAHSALHFVLHTVRHTPIHTAFPRGSPASGNSSDVFPAARVFSTEERGGRGEAFPSLEPNVRQWLGYVALSHSSAAFCFLCAWNSRSGI